MKSKTKKRSSGNILDEKLIERTLKEKSYPLLRTFDMRTSKIKYVRGTRWDRNQSLHRNPDFTKKLMNELEKLYRKVVRDWNDFWDLCEDSKELYCFVCGRYIIPKMRDDSSRIKHPYKNADPCHEYCWGKEMTVERSLGKINPDAELICHVDEVGAGVVCRKRIKNTMPEVYAHVLEHGIEVTELNFPFESYRSRYFLRPNGKPFTNTRGN